MIEHDLKYATHNDLTHIYRDSHTYIHRGGLLEKLSRLIGTYTSQNLNHVTIRNKKRILINIFYFTSTY